MLNFLGAFTLCILVLTANPMAWAADKTFEQKLRDGKVLAEAGRFKDAVAVLKKVEPEQREDELALNLLIGRIYLKLDRSATALDFYQKAYDQDIENFDAAIGVASAHVQLGNFKEAKQFIGIAKAVGKNSPEPLLLESLIQYRTGSIDAANRQISQLVSQRPDSVEVAIVYARYLQLTGDNVKAISSLRSFTDKHPQSAETWDFMGDLEQLFGSKDKGIKNKKLAAQMYDQQGNLFKRDVVLAWLQVNAPLEAVKPPQPTQPEVSTKNAPPQPPSEKTQPIEQPKPNLPKAVKQTVPTDKDLNFPVQRFPFPDGVMITGGSGFIVDGGKKVVTNRHVVEGGKEFAVRTGLGEVIKAKLVFMSKTDDIAVIELDKPQPNDRSISNTAYSKPRVGRNVVVMGYPLWSILGQGSPSLTNGVVSKRTGMGDDTGTFQLTAKVNKGNSGGPVFDMAGNVVGITVGKLDTKKIQEEQGFVPEDVNFAIHVDRLPKLINAQFDTKEISAVELSAEDLYQTMIGKVVMVATYK
jgi:S1-C subfamily serine protease